MSSAAKLRKYGRGTATVAAAALVMTSFGPTAFAWQSSTAGASDTAGNASIGLVDTDQAKEGTQGATAVSPAGSGQAVGDVRFVLPSTWAVGDTVSFTLAADGVGSTPADGVPDGNPSAISDAVVFSSTPAISIDPQAYASDTHVADYSQTYVAPGAAKTSSEKDGATEGGKLTKYVANGTTTGPALAPDFEVLPLDSSGGTGNGLNRVTIRFKNNSAGNNATAKYIGTLRGIKVDVGSNVAGQIALTASATGTNPPAFTGDAGATSRATTYVAAVFAASLNVTNGTVVADGSQQNVGPFTVAAASGKTLGASAVSVGINGATFVNKKVTATAYNAANAVVSTGDATVGANSLSYTPSGGNAANTTKVVFTDAMVNAPTTATAISYSLLAAGSIATPGATMVVGANGHQLDIKTTAGITQTDSTATSLPDRIGGQDRYQTAVKIAERALGTDAKGPKGESDNVVIASGEGFADALSAGYLAATKNAQLILTRAGSLPQTDVEFLKTYGAKNVFIVGGTGSVGKAVEDQLRGMQSYDVQSATTSTSTSTTYSAKFGTVTGAGTGLTATTVSGLTTQPATGDVIVTVSDGGTSGDAATVNVTGAGGAGWAASTTSTVNTNDNGFTAGVVTLTREGKTVKFNIPSVATAAGSSVTTIPQTSTTDVTATPGAGSTSGADAQGADRKIVPLQANLTVTRLAGGDRFETNRRVNEYAGATSVNPIGQTIPEYGKPYAKTGLVVNGMAPWDALAAGPLVSKTGSMVTKFPLPVILTSGSTLNANARTQMQTLDVQRAVFIGGSGVLPDSLMGEADKLGAYSSRLAGADRWGTAKAVAEFALNSDVPSTTNRFPGLNFKASATNPILANGGSMNGDMASAVARGAWADALAAGPMAAKASRLIALTDSRSLPGTTKDMLSANKAAFLVPVLAVGLGDVISTETIAAANAAIAQ